MRTIAGVIGTAIISVLEVGRGSRFRVRSSSEK